LKQSFVVLTALASGLAAVAQAQGQAPSKIAIIHVQSAILSTKDGQKAQQDLQTKFLPRRSAIEKKQSELAALQDQLKKGSATMSDAAKDKVIRDIDSLDKSIKRDGEDFDADVQQEEGKIMNDLGQKMMDVIIKYANQNGFAMVVDVSNPQTPVLWADQTINITEPIVKLYDQAHAGGASAPAPAPAASKPAAPAAAAPKPAAPATAPAARPPAAPPATKK
jgi:outer membrane protein